MFRSLAGKLILANLIGVLVAIGVFTAISASQIQANSNRVLDQILLERFHRLTRGPGRGPRPFQAGPNGQPNGNAIIPGQGNGLHEPQLRGEQDPEAGQVAPGQRRGPPLDALPRNSRILNLDGTVEWPDTETEALSQPLFNQSKTQGLMFADSRLDGLSVRIASGPFTTPDGRRLVGQVALENNTPALIHSSWRNALLVLIPSALGIASIVAWLVSRLILRPVRAAVATAEAVAQDPESAARIPIDTDDEMGRMGLAVNSMVDKIQASTVEVRQALENQRRFSSDAAHELRTPLAAIRLNAENALHPKASESEKDEALADIARLGAHMTRLTEMLLTLARLDRGQEQLSMENVALESTIQEAIRFAQGQEDPRIQLHLETPTIRANRDAVVQIMRNLIENARAYTPTRGAITIRCSAEGFSVHNDGPPIAAEHLPRLFDRFYRADSSRNRATGGYGLGLSIVQALAKSMGFQVRVESNSASGTTFFIDFSKTSESSQDPHSKNP